MANAYSQMRVPYESEESFKSRFGSERSRQYDVIKSKKAAFKYADGCTQRASVLLSAQDKLTPSNGRQLNHVIKEHTEAVNKLSQVIEVLQNHDSTLFQPNGRLLKDGTAFQHSFNAKEMQALQQKRDRMTSQLEVLTTKWSSFRQLFKGLKGKYHGRRGKKKKRKQTKNKKETGKTTGD